MIDEDTQNARETIHAVKAESGKSLCGFRREVWIKPKDWDFLSNFDTDIRACKSCQVKLSKIKKLKSETKQVV